MIKLLKVIKKGGVMKLLKDIRDSLRGGARPPKPDNNNDNNDDDDNNNNEDDDIDDKEFVSPLLEEINNKKYTNYDDDDDDDDDDDRPDYNNIPDLGTEEEASERISKNALDKFENNIEIEMNNLDKIVKIKKMNLVLN